MDPTFAIKFFGALFAIMNPLSGLPVFLTMTEGAGPAVQRTIALKVAAYIAIMGVIVTLAGAEVLKFFGISIHDLQVAGGLVVLGIAFSMLHGNDNTAHHGTEAEQVSFADTSALAFYPLTFPLMMGPGTMTTMILFAGQVKTPQDWVGYAAAFGIVVAAVGLVFGLGSRLGRHLSGSARVIMSRVMGLILAAIAVEMIFSGARALLPGLAGS